MPDFPATFGNPNKTIIQSHGPAGLIGDMLSSGSSAQVWQTTNRAIFMPIFLEYPVLAQAMAVRVSVQSGNLDVGIYTLAGAKIVTSGTTAVAAAGLQILDIADTWLAAGTYFLALSVNNTTASFFGSAQTDEVAVVCGVQQMNSAFVLPATATFANPQNSLQPLILLQCGNAML